MDGLAVTGAGRNGEFKFPKLKIDNSNSSNPSVLPLRAAEKVFPKTTELCVGKIELFWCLLQRSTREFDFWKYLPFLGTNQNFVHLTRPLAMAKPYIFVCLCVSASVILLDGLEKVLDDLNRELEGVWKCWMVSKRCLVFSGKCLMVSDRGGMALGRCWMPSGMCQVALERCWMASGSRPMRGRDLIMWPEGQ